MKQHNCPNCVYSTVDKRYLRNHIKNVHEEPKTIDSNVETANHFCSQCDYKTYSERGLNRSLNIESSHFLLSDWSIPTGSNSNKEVGSRAGAC